ncbi:glycoside hydrolase family 15 protein [Streptomyces mirabilis]
MSNTPIADYALLSDCHTAALVSRDGSIDWLCLPAFDARAVFARLLDQEAGHWSIRPLDPYTTSRLYLDRSMVLQTQFRTATGMMTVSDALACGPNESGHDLGTHAPHLLLRVVKCTQGTIDVSVEFAPRPEYGLVQPLLTPANGGLLCHGGPDTFGLSAPAPFDIGDLARAHLTLHAGEQTAFALQHAPAGHNARLWSPAQIQNHLQTTLEAWQSWADLHQAYEGMWQEQVHHSGRVLQALTFRPTGAIVAAPTTSLPEQIGGVRNWDYRYAWVRDASFTLDALWIAACPDEAKSFFNWMAQAAAVAPGRQHHMQIMFGIRGERDLIERELDHLSGWRNSRPVRVGNAARRQRQIDVYGHLLSAAHRLRPYLSGVDATTRRFLVGLADAAAVHWKEPDQGIWEVRSEPQHFLCSKLMCWVALDRAIDAAETLQATDRVGTWTQVREDVRTATEEQGWNETVGAYTQAFGSTVLDAAVLVMPLVGFTPATSPRMQATIRTVRDQLTGSDGLLYRYHATDDGLPGSEGTFLLCTFWLAQALAMAGDIEAACCVFDRAAGAMNDVGLMAEEVDPDSGEMLGNFPQAFSHIGLINAAWSISQAKESDLATAKIAEGAAYYRAEACARVSPRH